MNKVETILDVMYDRRITSPDAAPMTTEREKWKGGILEGFETSNRSKSNTLERHKKIVHPKIHFRSWIYTIA